MVYGERKTQTVMQKAVQDMELTSTLKNGISVFRVNTSGELTLVKFLVVVAGAAVVFAKSRQ